MKKYVKKIIAAAAAVLVTSGLLLITFGSSLGVPGWQQIFAATGLQKITDTKGELTVHFIDVGKADSIYINSGDFNILIDAGLESVNKITESYLKNCGVKKLDLVVATHQDKDHIGDMAGIVNDFDIDTFWMPNIPDKLKPDSSCYENLLTALSNKKLVSTQPESGKSFTYGDITLTVIAPVKNDYSDINNYSIVLKLQYGEKSFLFMGDAMKESENDILTSGADIKADVLKVGHHGSSSGTTNDFLQAVSPSYAVISVGENDNDLPKKSVIKKLENSGAAVYRTDTQGTIVFSCTKDNITVTTEK